MTLRIPDYGRACVLAYQLCAPLFINRIYNCLQLSEVEESLIVCCNDGVCVGGPLEGAVCLDPLALSGLGLWVER